ncbi:Adenosine kinase [Dictyocoela muelleri]|nr:Adenosine kinase [Dictyocoela muelleri]
MLNQIIKKDVESNNINFNKSVFNLTATCFVMINNNERTLATFTGASEYLSESFFKNSIKKISGINLVYINLDTWSLKCINNILKLKSKIVLNLFSEIILPTIDKSILKRIFDCSSIIVGNKLEILEFGKLIFGFELDLKRCIQMLTRFDKFIICTDGNKSVKYATQDFYKEKSVEKIELENLNTCGAGDAFAAGVLIGIYKNYKHDDIVNKGMELARKWIIEKSDDHLNQ